MAKVKRVMLLSHGILSSTGFARVIYQIGRRLVDEGYEVYVPNREYHGKPLKFDSVETLHGEDYSGINILGFGTQQFGEDVVPVFMEKYNIDLVITLGDIYAYQYIRSIDGYGENFRWIAYYALDTNNLVRFWVDNIRNFDIPVVMSEFGQELCAKHELSVKHIPHAVDCNVFRPCEEHERNKWRKELGVPHDAFVVGCVAHNHRRKMLDKMLNAFMIHLRKNPNAVLLMHSQPTPGQGDGWDFNRILETYGLLDKVYFTNFNSKGVGDALVSDEDMRKLYCTFDVHMLLTGGEGFGIPFIESMACGIPNITTAYTTGPEILHNHTSFKPAEVEADCGFLVPPDGFYTHPTGGLWAYANEGVAALALEKLSSDKKLCDKLGTNARKKVLEKYNLKRITDMWVDLVETLNVKPREKTYEFPLMAKTLINIQEAANRERKAREELMIKNTK